MKRLSIFAFLAILAAVMFINTSSASGEYYYYTPYFMERADLEKSVKYIDTPRDMSDPGKIYVKDEYLFVNERYKGVHVINNANPAAPEAVAFITAPGCIDMAVKGNILYLDNAVDLVAFDLSARQEKSRIKRYFPEPVSPIGDTGRYIDRPDGFVLVGWTRNVAKRNYYE